MTADPENLTGEYAMGFRSFSDYLHFIEKLQNSPDFESIPVDSTYAWNIGFAEHWFRHRESNQVYRLVEPDAPFRGAWEKVTQPESD